MTMTDAKTSSRDNRILVRSLIVGLFVLMQAILVVFVKHDVLDMNIRPNTQPSLDFYGAIDIGQTFRAEGANIGRIDLLFGTHGRRVSYPVGFELYEIGPSKTLVATSGIDASSLRDNLFQAFRFPVVRGSRGKRYLIRLFASSATAANAMAIWKNSADIYPDGTMVYNGAPDSGDLIFRVYSRRAIASELGRIVAGNPGVLGSPALFAAVVLLLEAAFIWALAAIVDRIMERRDGDV
jgi:hypothetical protein